MSSVPEHEPTKQAVENKSQEESQEKRSPKSKTKTSYVYQAFNLISGKVDGSVKAICKQCGASLTYNQKTTTNMLNHVT